MLHAIRVLYFDNFVNDNVVDVQSAETITKYYLKEITADGSCKDQLNDCREEFMSGVGSWTMAQDCQCQQLSENKRRCQCCINCGIEPNLLRDTLHLRQIDEKRDRCSK